MAVAKNKQSFALLLEERNSLLAEWQEAHNLLAAARSEPPDRHKGEVESPQTRLTGVEARISEIDRIFSKDFANFAALIPPRPLTVAEVQARLRADEAMVLFLDTSKIHDVPEEAFLWVVTKTEMRWVRIGAGTEGLIESVAVLRCGLDRGSWEGAGLQRCASLLKISVDRAPKAEEPLPFDLVRAYGLYRTLFDQVEDLIKGKRLLVVPSGPLTALPFNVLVTEAPGVAIPTEAARYADAAWLAKNHAVTVLPSVAILQVLRDFAKASMATRPFVGFGNPLLVGPSGSDRRAWDHESCSKRSPAPIHHASQAVPMDISDLFRNGLARVDKVRAQYPLPETAEKLCLVAELVGASADTVYLGKNATETKIKALSADGTLARARVVHLATYGLLVGEAGTLAPNRTEPAFILTPPAMGTNTDDGLLTASEIAQLQLDADWVVLSAYNTAIGGKHRLGAEALSALASVFFHAGARTLVVSHWRVNPEAAVKLVTGAFGAIKINPAGGRAQALQWSMLALMGSGGRNAHPALWAPFVVVGKAWPS
jgi:CHAT domain-containing protein